MIPEVAIRILQRKFEDFQDPVAVPLMNGVNTFSAELVDGGIEVSNLGNYPFLPWSVFRAVIKLLNEEDGFARKGNAMNGKLGNENLPFNSVEGRIASEVYDYIEGEIVFKRVTPVAAILAWAGICENGRGSLSYLSTLDLIDTEGNDRAATATGPISEIQQHRADVNFNDVVASFVEQYLSRIDYNDTYWKGKSWRETLQYRRGNRLTEDSEQEALERVLAWGGIYNFKQWNLYCTALETLVQGEPLTEDIYSRISSFSKLFSFYNPDEFFILDARVAFMLNYLVKTQMPDQPGFDFPFVSRSRNEGLVNAAPLLTLKNYYPNLGEAYYAYNKLVLDVYEKLLAKVKVNIASPEIIEMVLFKATENFFAFDRAATKTEEGTEVS